MYLAECLSVRRWDTLSTKHSIVCLVRMLFESSYVEHSFMSNWLILRRTKIYIYIYYHENNVPFRLSPQWLFGDSCTWAHDACKYMSCHKAIVVITGRTHCFHDNIYVTLILLLWELSTPCVVDHLWPLYIYYIYINYM